MGEAGDRPHDLRLHVGLPLLTSRERDANSLRYAFQFTHPQKRWIAPIQTCPKTHFVQKQAAGIIDYD